MEHMNDLHQPILQSMVTVTRTKSKIPFYPDKVIIHVNAFTIYNLHIPVERSGTYVCCTLVQLNDIPAGKNPTALSNSSSTRLTEKSTIILSP